MVCFETSPKVSSQYLGHICQCLMLLYLIPCNWVTNVKLLFVVIMPSGISLDQEHHIIKILKFEFVGGDRSTLNFGSCQFLCGEGGEGRGGEGGQLTLNFGSCQFVGGEGGEGMGGGQSTLTLKVKLGLPCRSWVDRH